MAKPSLSSLRLARAMSGVARTINLAEPKRCERPAVQKLVSADVTRACPQSQSQSQSQSSSRTPTAVRVCRRKDLERSCQPKLCACPQKLRPKTTKQILGDWLVLGTKGAFVAGLAYWSVAEGIWGDNDHTEDLYRRIRETINPDLDGIGLPRTDNIKFKIWDSYNQLILKLVAILTEIPMKLGKRLEDTLHPCKPEEPDDKNKKKGKKKAEENKKQ